MAYRNGNYTAFYVDEPFSESNLSAAATKDFCYYNLLRAWAARDSNFKFIDSNFAPSKQAINLVNTVLRS